MALKIASATDVRNNLFTFLRNVQESGGPVYVTVHNKPVVVMLSPEQYEELQELARLSREIADEQEREGE